MNGSVLLGTPVAIAHLRRQNDRFIEHLERGGRLYLPVIGLGELYIGIERSVQREASLVRLAELLRLVTILYPKK
jgi:predicted nucleic acid-binding protein